MEHQERVIGSLLAYREMAEKRLDGIETKLDSLLSFRWKFTGIVSVASLVGGGVVEVLIALLVKHGG